MNYVVKITAPGINEQCMTSADDEQQAIARCAYSALNRMIAEDRVPPRLQQFIDAGDTVEENAKRASVALVAEIKAGDAAAVAVPAPADAVMTC